MAKMIKSTITTTRADVTFYDASKEDERLFTRDIRIIGKVSFSTFVKRVEKYAKSKNIVACDIDNFETIKVKYEMPAEDFILNAKPVIE